MSFPPTTWPVAEEPEIEFVTGELANDPVYTEPFMVEEVPIPEMLTVVAVVDPTRPPVLITPLVTPEELEFEIEVETDEPKVAPVLTALFTVTPDSTFV